MKNKVNFVTGNHHKFKEISEYLKEEGIDYVLKQKDLKPIEIQANTIKEVALYKLNSIISKLNDSFFIEDSGFFVEVPLNGFPGVYSSYVLKTIGNQGILKLINDFGQSKASFSAVIALFFKPLEKVFLFDSIVRGRVSERSKGKGGFGFDPIFIPDEIPDKTFAELSVEEKNKISHRGQAIKKLITFLREH